MNRHLAKEDTQVDNKHEKIHSIMNHFTGKMQTKTIMRYCLTVIRMAMQKNEKIKIKYHATRG